MITLDTNSTIWMTTDKNRLSLAAASAVRESSRHGDGIFIASTTLWEIAMLLDKNRIRLPTPLGQYLRYLERAFVVLPITSAIAERSTQFNSKFPGDPSDRIISATAIIHGSKLITSDKQIRSSGEVDCIW